MSESKTIQMECPHCHYKSPLTIWPTIIADSDPALADKFLSEELFTWKCEVCGYETNIPFNTTYFDNEHKFVIAYSPIEFGGLNIDKDQIDNMFGNRINEFTFRSVYDMNEFREKVAIFKSGLNDIAIERMRFFLLLDPQQGLTRKDKLWFLEVSSEDATDPMTNEPIFKYGLISFIKISPDSPPAEKGFRMELYYNYLLAVKVDPRMIAEPFACINQTWIESQLKKV
jgi:hypothetical protein